MRDLGRFHFTDNLDITDDLLTEAAIDKARMKIFEPGCILFPRSGSVALNHRAILGIRASVVSHIGVLKGFASTINSRFLYRCLQSFDMTRLSKKTTGVDSIAFSDVKGIPIPLPPLPEQERIAAILDAAEALRSLREQADRRTADLIPALFHEMFGDPATNPKGWRIEKLEDVCSTTSGGTPDRNNGNYFGGDIPWVKSGELNQKIILKTEECLTDAGLQNSSAKLQPPGTILLAMYGATVGAVAILGIHASTNQAICCIQTGSHLVTDYLYALIKISTPMFLNQRVGGAQPNISQKIIRNMQIPIPPLSLQRAFSARVAGIRTIDANQVTSRRRLDDLFQSLLHRAFRGEF